MPVNPTYPGVYVEEVPNGSYAITGVPTSITAFIGRSERGFVDRAVQVNSFGEFTRLFGGLWEESFLGYNVQQYFMNGGGEAIIVRVDKEGVADRITLEDDGSTVVLELEAVSPGEWGNNLRAIVDHNTDDGAVDRFNLIIQEFDPATADSTAIPPVVAKTLQEEVFHNVSIKDSDPRYIGKVLETSMLVQLVSGPPLSRPAETGIPAEENAKVAQGTGTNGIDITAAQIAGAGSETNRRGIYALENVDIFNMLVIPPLARDNGDVDFTTVYIPALHYCEKRRAMLIMDPPADWVRPDIAIAAAHSGDFPRHQNAILYWPRVRLADPLRENRIEEFTPGAMMAGVIARTDGQRGVWKAPAGPEATLTTVCELAYRMNNAENGQLNPLAINALRTFQATEPVAWGARTTGGTDQLASEWKYIPVRRLALHIEESLYRGTQWAVFEPNDAALWARLRAVVGGFMHVLFRQGAFQGSTPKDAYFVKCDSETTTQKDIDRGIINILVGFAPLKPAEFVVIKIQQFACEDV